MIRLGSDVVQQRRRVILVVNSDIDFTIVVIVEEGHAASRSAQLKTRAGDGRHVLKGPVTQIAVEHVLLAVRRLRMAVAFKLRIHMTVGNE